MYSKNNKKRLYWLIDRYLSGEISESEFCDEYYYCYDLGLDGSNLTPTEQSAFRSLSEIANRFSEFEDDHRRFPGGFYTVSQLKQKVIETNEKLAKERS